MNKVAPGFLFGGETWGWRAWVPFAAVVLISALITRSFHPLRMLFTNIFDDWTLLTFGLLSCMPVFISVYFDEINNLYSIYFMVILAFLMAGTVIIYMRSASQRARIGVLLVGIFLIIAIAVAGSTIYWLNHGGTNVPAPIIGGIIVYLIMFSPALISLFHRTGKV